MSAALSGVATQLRGQSFDTNELTEEIAGKGFAVGRILGSLPGWPSMALEIILFDHPSAFRRFPRSPLQLDYHSVLDDFSWSDAGAGISLLYDPGTHRGYTVFVFDVHGNLLWNLPGFRGVAPRLSADLQQISYFSHDPYFSQLKDPVELRIEDSRGNRKTFTAADWGLADDYGTAIGWHPNGSRIAASWNGETCIFNTETGTCVDRLEAKDPCWSPRGTYFSYRKPDKHRIVLDSSGKEIFRTPHQTAGGSTSGLFSPDEQYLLSNEPRFFLFHPFSSKVVVYRIRDRKHVTLWDNGLGRLFGVGWIENASEEIASLDPIP